MFFILPISWNFMALSLPFALGFLIPLVEYFIAVFFWRSWLSSPIISSTGAFDWACSKKYDLRICVISSTCLRAYKPVCVVLGPWH